MKLILIVLATLTIARCHGNPLGYEVLSSAINQNWNVQPIHTLAGGDLQSPYTVQAATQVNKPLRREYRKFGADVVRSSTQDISNFYQNYNLKDEKSTRRSDHQGSLSHETRDNNFPAVQAQNTQNERYEKSVLKSNAEFAANRVSKIQTAMSNQNTYVAEESRFQNQKPNLRFNSNNILRSTSQLATEGSVPGTVDNRFSEGVTRVNQGSFQNVRPAFQNQVNSQVSSFVERNQYTGSGRRISHQTDNPTDIRVHQDNQMRTQSSKDQFKTSFSAQEMNNQFQNQGLSRHVEEGHGFNPKHGNFELENIFNSAGGQPSRGASSGEGKQHISTFRQFQSNQPSVDPKNGDLKQSGVNLNVEIGSKPQFNQYESHSRTQGLLQNLGKEQKSLTLPQFPQPHAISTYMTGSKSASPVPLMVYKTKNIGSPHAMVLGRGTTTATKASLSLQHQSPYTQYSYSHNL